MNVADRFTALLARPSAEFDLLEAAASLPLYADPEVDVDRVLSTVRGWGDALARRVPADASPIHRLRLLNHLFFDELGFRGAEDDYASPMNSYLHRVIERRRGIPIALCVLYAALARAVALPVQGVGFPGHFIVRLALHAGDAYLDVYRGGQTLAPAQLRARLQALYPAGGAPPLATLLRPATDAEVLVRMLRNLKALHLDAQDWPLALNVQARLMMLLPDQAEEYRDRALVWEQLECPRAALDDWVAYLSLHPSPPDMPNVQRRMSALRRAAQSLN